MRSLLALLILLATSSAASAALPELPPARHDFEAGGARITAELDRGMVTAGDRVTLALTARAPDARTIALDVLVLAWDFASEDHGYFRVVRARTVNVATSADGTGTLVARLPLARGRDRWHWHLIAVRAHDGERPRVGASYKTYPWDDPPTDRAELGVLVWAGNAVELAITTTRAPANRAFVVDVTVQNLTPRAIRPQLTLGTRLDPSGFVATEALSIDPEDDGERRLAAGATRTYRFTVTAPEALAEPLVLVASAGPSESPIALDARTLAIAP